MYQNFYLSVELQKLIVSFHIKKIYKKLFLINFLFFLNNLKVEKVIFKPIS